MFDNNSFDGAIKIMVVLAVIGAISLVVGGITLAIYVYRHTTVIWN